MVLTRQEIERLIDDKVVCRQGSIPVVDAVSVTLHLGNQLAYYQTPKTEPFVPPQEMPLSHITISGPADGYVLQPKGAVLAASDEAVAMPLGLMGLIQTRSSLARGFLMAHPSAGHIEPGYKGIITFELVNLSEFSYRLIPGMPIAKLFFLRLSSEIPPGQGYDGRYQNSTGPIGMK